MPVSDHLGLRNLAVDRASLVEWYLRNRERSRRLFDLIDPEVYYTRPIALRNPIVFYEGHLPAFSVIAFLQRGLGHSGVDERLERLFARGIDPDSVDAAVPRSGASTLWPDRKEVLAFGAAADEAVLSALRDAPFVEDRPAMLHGEAIYTALEHEAMHQETLLYMWHRLPHDHKRKPIDLTYEVGGAPVAPDVVRIPAGRATLGAERSGGRFGWDNEFGEVHVDVPAFEIDIHNVTNAEYLAFVEARRLSHARALDGSRLGVARERAARIPHLLVAAWWRVVLARDVRGPAAAAGVACLRQPGRSECVRALEEASAADRGGVPPRRIRNAGRA